MQATTQLPGGVAAGIRRFTIGSKENGGGVKVKEERRRRGRRGDDNDDNNFDLDASIEVLVPPPQFRSLSAGYR